MRFFYTLFIVLYAFAARIVALKSPKAKQWVAGRKHVLKNIKSQLQPNQELVWFHCASLGEFEQGRPLIELLKAKQPHLKILLTFFSPSGYEVRKNYPFADYVFYLPSDSPAQANCFFDIVKPKLIFFVKYEFWYNYIAEAKRRNIPFYSLSCIFRKNQIYFKPYGKWFLKQLKGITCFFTQDVASQTLLHSFGINQTKVCGDTRFDRVMQVVAQAKCLPDVASFCQDEMVLVAGSTWKEDEILLAQLLPKLPIKLVIAPHQIEAERIADLQQLFADYPTSLYSKEMSESSLKNSKVLIIDTMGMLSSVYHYGNICYIGGGFSKGIHNTLEAATHGKPVIFGPNYQKFKEAHDLIAAEAAFSVSDFQDLEAMVSLLCSNTDKRNSAGENAQCYVKNNAGACQKIYQELINGKVLS